MAFNRTTPKHYRDRAPYINAVRRILANMKQHESELNSVEGEELENKIRHIKGCKTRVDNIVSKLPVAARKKLFKYVTIKWYDR